MEKKKVIAALSALAHETRLDIFRLLVRVGPEGMAAGRLAERLSLPPATLSFHLSQLSQSHLVESRRDGRHIFYSAGYRTINRLTDFLMRNCCQGPGEQI